MKAVVVRRAGELEGALVEPMAVGLHAVDTGRIRSGEVVGVFGAGPIGLAILIWARHFGARAVVVAETSPLRRAMASRLGASWVVDPAESSLPTALPELMPGLLAEPDQCKVMAVPG